MEFNFDKAMSRLTEISELMAKDDISLDECMALYNEAAELAGKCELYLEQAKFVVEQTEMKASAQ